MEESVGPCLHQFQVEMSLVWSFDKCQRVSHHFILGTGFTVAGGGVLCRTVLFLSFSLVFNLLWFSSFAMRQLANTELVNTNFMLKQERILKPFIKSGVPFSSTNVYPTS